MAASSLSMSRLRRSPGAELIACVTLPGRRFGAALHFRVVASSNPAWSEDERTTQNATSSWSPASVQRGPAVTGAPAGHNWPAALDGEEGELTDPLRDSPLPELAPPGAGECLVLRPGETPAVFPKSPLSGKAVVLASTGLVLANGVIKHHCRTPASREAGRARWPLATRLVSITVRHRPEGRRSEPVRLVYALDASGRIVGHLDVSDTWEMRSDALAAVAHLAGMTCEVYRFEEARDLLAAHPEWAAPQLEWFVNHHRAESGREWAWGIWAGGTLAVVFGGFGMVALIISPIGPIYDILLLTGGVVSGLLTLWSRSRWRMRRSLRKAGYTGVAIASPPPGRRGHSDELVSPPPAIASKADPGGP